MIKSLSLQGFKSFKSLEMEFRPLNVIVGANGSGKSNLFDFLRFLRDGVEKEIPPETIFGQPGQELFFDQRKLFKWALDLDVQEKQISWGAGLSKSNLYNFVPAELIVQDEPRAIYLVRENRKVVIDDKVAWADQSEGQFALQRIRDSQHTIPFAVAEFIRRLKFYSSFKIDRNRIRRSIPVEQSPVFAEDGGNLSSVLFDLMTRFSEDFAELKRHLKLLAPKFKNLSVRARGGPGEVIAFWEEANLDFPLTLADLSDGILHLLCWLVLCVHPNPPPLVCIDEPELGLHPKVLPYLAALFQKLSDRTQVIITTHSSYFLSQFDLKDIFVMVNERGESVLKKPADSAALRANLEDFGPQELEMMHQTDELEALS